MHIVNGFTLFPHFVIVGMIINSPTNIPFCICFYTWTCTCTCTYDIFNVPVSIVLVCFTTMYFYKLLKNLPQYFTTVCCASSAKISIYICWDICLSVLLIASLPSLTINASLELISAIYMVLLSVRVID